MKFINYEYQYPTLKLVAGSSIPHFMFDKPDNSDCSAIWRAMSSWPESDSWS